MKEFDFLMMLGYFYHDGELIIGRSDKIGVGEFLIEDYMNCLMKYRNRIHNSEKYQEMVRRILYEKFSNKSI